MQAQINEDSENATISLCMIVRDNEKTIRPALESAKPWVDEIIVVDTGSNDRTPQIAEEIGAKVSYYKWCDDFAAARNESLSKATCDWIFWMDSDDTLPSHCGEQLREILNHREDNEALGYIMQVHCPPTQHHNDASQTYNMVTVVDHIKLFQNRSDFRFEGRIHEQILPSIRRANGEVSWTEAYVVHSGSDQSPLGTRRKLARDLRLLKMEVREKPEHPFVHFNLGMTLLFSEQYRDAAGALVKCIELSTTGESHLRKAYALLVEVLLQQNKKKDALRRAWEGLGRFPGDPELAFKLGTIYMRDNYWHEAVDAFEIAVSHNSKRFFSSIDPGIKGYKAYANLGLAYENLGQWDKAAENWSECINSNPRFEDAWEALSRIVPELKETHVLTDIAQRHESNNSTAAYVATLSAGRHEHRGELKQAKSLYESALSKEPENPLALNLFAGLLHKTKDWRKSETVLKQLHRIQPRNPSVLYNLGFTLMQLKRYGDAFHALRTSSQLRPKHAATHKLMESTLNHVFTNRVQNRHHSPNLILASCFLNCLDTQRGVEWYADDDLYFAVMDWVLSIERNELNATILHNGVPEEFLNRVASTNVSWVECVLNRGVSTLDARHLAFEEYLVSHPYYENVYCTDLFDLRLEQDPFRLFEQSQKIYVAIESMRIRDNAWLLDKWEKTYNELPGTEVMDRQVLNVGLFGGTYQVVKDFLTNMKAEILEHSKSTSMVVDMPVFNKIVYNTYPPENIWAKGAPLHSNFTAYEFDRTDVAFIHK